VPTHRVGGARSRFFLDQRAAATIEPWFTAEEIPFSGSEGGPRRKEVLARLTSVRRETAIGVYPAAETRKRAFLTAERCEKAPAWRKLLPNVSPLQREWT